MRNAGRAAELAGACANSSDKPDHDKCSSADPEALARFHLHFGRFGDPLETTPIAVWNTLPLDNSCNRRTIVDARWARRVNPWRGVGGRVMPAVVETFCGDFPIPLSSAARDRCDGHNVNKHEGIRLDPLRCLSVSVFVDVSLTFQTAYCFCLWQFWPVRLLTTT